MFNHAAYRQRRRADPVYRRRELDRDNANRRAHRKRDPAKFCVWDQRAYTKHKRRWKERSLKRHYGITLDEWNAMFVVQECKCASCGQDTPGRKDGFWHTDHDHKTGKVRGILCNGCNRAAGYLSDDPERCRLLAKYLEKGSGSYASN
jgi:Autographiviridae endonuclease VII